MKPLPALCIAFAIFTPSAWVHQAVALDYKKDILPIFDRKCFKCHSDREGVSKGSLILDDLEEFEKYSVGPNHPVVPGDPEKSDLLRFIELPSDDNDAMPPSGKGEPLSDKEKELVRQWIVEGAVVDANKKDKDDDKPMNEAPALAERKVMSWTNAQGKVIEAAFLRLSGDSVELLMNGKAYKVPLASLSSESQAQAKSLASGESGL